MTDCFALLDEERRPWLEAGELKRKFLARSSEVHPDRFHQSSEAEKAAAGKHYAELNRAHDTLSSHRDRVRHLIALERGEAPADIQQTPAELMDLFFECGALCQGVDKFLNRKDAADSPLLKVQLFQEGLEWTDKIQSLNDRIAGKLGEVEEALRGLDARWSEDRESRLDGLEAIYRNLSYYERWRSQLQARFIRLAT